MYGNIGGQGRIIFLFVLDPNMWHHILFDRWSFLSKDFIQWLFLFIHNVQQLSIIFRIIIHVLGLIWDTLGHILIWVDVSPLGHLG